MQRLLKNAILRLFPELSGGLHYDRYAKVTGVADSPTAGASSERFRPRYAVDIQILTPDMEPDPAFPPYTAVPLPVPMGAGGEAGAFASPRPGAIVTVGFAYGRQDHPIIKNTYPMGDNLPDVAQGETLLQQSPTVFQRADAGGNWTRETDAGITDKSVKRAISALESVVELGQEIKRVSQSSSIEVDGMQTIEVGTALTMLAGTRADIGSLGAVNLTAGGDSSHSTGGNAVETVGGDHASKVTGGRSVDIGGSRAEKVEGGQTTNIGGGETREVGGGQNVKIGADHALDVGGGSTEIISGNKTIQAGNINLNATGTLAMTSEAGGGSVNYFRELVDALGDIQAALDVLATHTHPEASRITQGSAVAAHSGSLGGHKGNMEGVTG